MPPEALHHAAKALANWTNSTSSPGWIVLAASLKTAMWMVCGPTPRTEEAPPGPGSQILPTPGQVPLVGTLDDNGRLADVAAVAAVDERATEVPASMTVAMASGSIVPRRRVCPFRNILMSSPRRLAIGTLNQHPH